MATSLILLLAFLSALASLLMLSFILYDFIYKYYEEKDGGGSASPRPTRFLSSPRASTTSPPMLAMKSSNSRRKRIQRTKSRDLFADPAILKWRTFLRIITKISVCAFLLHAIALSLTRFANLSSSLQTDSLCDIAGKFRVILYHTCRCTLYTLLITRLHTSFHGSQYSYNFKRILLPLFIYVLCYQIFIVVADILFTGAVFDASVGGCVTAFADWGVYFSATTDMVLSVVTLILFIRPLRKLRNAKQRITTTASEASAAPTKNPATMIAGAAVTVTTVTAQTNQNREPKRAPKSKSTRNSNKMDKLVVKYALLVMICLFSSLMLYAVVFLTPGWGSDMAVIDDTINVYCIYLLSASHRKIYNRICSQCEKCCLICCGFRKMEFNVRHKKSHKLNHENVISISLEINSDDDDGYGNHDDNDTKRNNNNYNDNDGTVMEKEMAGIQTSHLSLGVLGFTKVDSLSAPGTPVSPT